MMVEDWLKQESAKRAEKFVEQLEKSWIDLNAFNYELEHNYIREQNFLKEFITSKELTDKEIEDLKTKYKNGENK